MYIIKLNEQRKIFKLHSTQLKKANWNLTLSFKTALSESPDNIIALGDSQVLRWIDEINGVTDANARIVGIKQSIKQEKRKNKTSKTKKRIQELYDNLYNLQFQKDYIAIIMDHTAHYDRANKGFIVNGIRYRRFLGTNGGIKNSTIVYVNEELYPELKRRLDNGRNKDVPLVPAKLEAYQALVCSGSTPIPEPKGFIVVNDCITHFKDDVILINDDTDGEPILTYEKNYEIEHNNSDGCGLMLPSYSRRVNEYLTGDGENTISGMNTRGSWLKGMVYTFDFIEFAEKVAGTYEIIDAWGDKRDVRDAEVILTVSMLKLWQCYDNWEDYYRNCKENHYQFSTPKITPEKLENVRTTNYQFLQSYDFTDGELQQLCQPTIDEIKDVLGLDYRKSIVFMVGSDLNEDNAKNVQDDAIKALMIEPTMINDPYVRKQIFNNIKKKIELAKKGSIKVNGNYAIISGDPYALAQSMFGLEITGLLKAGEIYHKHWSDKGEKEVACFRAPMTNQNNIRRMKLCSSPQAQYWYRYITTAQIFNAWDTACEAMNGQDFDADTNMTTNNPIILAMTENRPTIICMQRKAKKVIPTESDLVDANKIAFNDDIGTITNHVTAMFEVQAGFAKDSEEYKELDYRIMCGQHYQQASVDRCKGIIAKPMPKYWFDAKNAKDHRELDQKIVASRKPYFMRYVYPNEKSKYDKYVANYNSKARMTFGMSIEDLYQLSNKDKTIEDFLYHYELFKPMGDNPCTVNKICRLCERTFDGYKPSASVANFDYSILTSGVGYSRKAFEEVKSIYNDYIIRVATFMQESKTNRITKDDAEEKRNLFVEEFKARCEMVCPDERVLCDIVLDLCYRSEKSKKFAWDVCGNMIIENLLRRNNFIMSIPVKDDIKEFEFNGEGYKMINIDISKQGE